ncbi:Aluminum-activated malate transporter 10 [Morella rubra]|uniref:Aluminum-activated malate transporter 10 n=1 Tax=Morella rubra TaxID=262757 RepID=A0A6A1W4W7_9ROSI|nr:Aluminum-activated malate transporter 10 [Morella rubra]
MAKKNEVSEKLESRINIPAPGRSSKELVSESVPVHKGWVGLKGFFSRPTLKIRRFLANAWSLAVADPRKVIHGCKVGLALTLVSLLYYIWPLFDGLGGNTVWAVLTVIVVFESTVGATISKSINRAMGTSLGGSLAVGVQMIARTSGKNIETVIVGTAIFFLVARCQLQESGGKYYIWPLFDGLTVWAVLTVKSTVGATISKSINRAMGTSLGGSLAITEIRGLFVYSCSSKFRSFIPSLKARFDYGVMVCILTFSMISVNGYRVEKLYEEAYERLVTVCIGISFCIFISMLFSPIWAGTQLHSSISRNMEKLADSLDGCVAEFFKSEDKTTPANEEDPRKTMQGYKFVLNTQASEESMANFARWEPAHGRFSFGHPWKQYLKTGAAVRNCAYYIEALHTCLNSEIKAPEYLKNSVQGACLTLSAYCSDVLKELALTLETMTRSSKIEFLVGQIDFAVEQLKDASKSIPHFLIADALSTIVDAPSDAAAKRDPNTIPVPRLPPLMEFLLLTKLVSVLIEIVIRIKSIVDAVDQLANLAKFKLPKEISGKTEAIHEPEKADQMYVAKFTFLMASKLTQQKPT